MDTFSALLAICAGNSPVPSGLPAQRPVTRIFDIFFDLRLNIRLSKQSWGWWFETLSCPLWRHCNGYETSRGLFSFSVNFDKGASQETELVIIPSASMKLKGGYTGFTLSVCPSVCGRKYVRPVSSTIPAGSNPYSYILSNNFGRCVTRKVCCKIPKFQYESIVWLIMGRRRVFSERRRSSCSG